MAQKLCVVTSNGATERGIANRVRALAHPFVARHIGRRRSVSPRRYRAYRLQKRESCLVNSIYMTRGAPMGHDTEHDADPVFGCINARA